MLRNTSLAQTAASRRQRVVEAKLHEALATMMRGTEVIKVKIYTLKWVTAFSTDLAQIGESKADNAGFRSAVGGVAISELTHRNQIDAFEGTLQDRDVIATYVPIHPQRGGQQRVEGVFEVYQDVSTFMRNADQQLKWVSASVVVAEGVTTSEQALFLHELGCDQIQGYLYGKPMAEADFYPQCCRAQ